jgi:hypothetical protein
MEFLAFLKTGGVLGFLFGLLFVRWINPGTTEGQLLLLLVCIAIGVILSVFIGGLFSWCFGSDRGPRALFKTLRKK